MSTTEVLDPRSEAIAAYQASLADGEPLTQAQLGARVGMSRSWARDLIHELRLVNGNGGGHDAEETGDAVAATEPIMADTAPEWPPPADVVAATDPAPAATVAAGPPWWRSLDGLTTLVVALVAAAASYGHMYHVALLAGESVWIARAWPITVDGLALVALRRGEAGRGWLALSLLVSVAANVAGQYPELAANAGPWIAAWPPLALFGCHHMTKHRHDRGPASTDT